MANDDWRIIIDVEGARGVAEHLGGELSDEARELAADLKDHRLSVSVDDETLFVYAATRGEAEKARAIVEAELRAQGIEAKTSRVEHWLDAEERWDNEPPHETWEQEELDRGFAPWEVRVQCGSRQEARDLAGRLEAEGYKPLRHFHYLIVGTASKEYAEALAQRLHGEVEVGGEVVLEELQTADPHPFAVFGGLGL
jgi:hypothetical protein